MIEFGNEWDELLADVFKSSEYQSLREFLKIEYRTNTIFPPMQDIFNAFRYTNYSEVKAVIIGQDPYHGYGQAHGLCFSVNKGVPPPPSLKNIYKEINSDLEVEINLKNGNLIKWANEGILLLNTILTVRERQAGSHRNKGWEFLTDRVIELLNIRKKPLVFLLWGAFARAKKTLITNPSHLILETVHPSPLSAFNGFFGCKHFSQTNNFLKKIGQDEIDWSIN